MTSHKTNTWRTREELTTTGGGEANIPGEGILREGQPLINERLLYRPETILIPTISSFKSLTVYPSPSLIGFLIGAI